MNKEDMKWLKENEPWTYDDYFSDPCGTDSDSGCFTFVLFLVVFSIVGVMAYYVSC